LFPEASLLLEADLDRTALVDERGCRRDIRSNGWIVFREGSLSQNRSGRRNWFSSFGAESLLRNFTGPNARLKSGPDVFADALVPRNASRSDCRAFGARRFRSFQIPYMIVLIAYRSAGAFACGRSCAANAEQRNVAILRNTSSELLQNWIRSGC
jgi:hypothetical protein